MKTNFDAIERMVEQIAKNLVDQPEHVQVSTVDGSRTMVLELRVAKGDVGKVIGKQGKTANALRVLLMAACGRQDKRTVLEIIE